jgi:hypothetical protein
MARRKVGNLLALPVLAFLYPRCADAPATSSPTCSAGTGKEHDLAIKWGSLYTVVQNLGSTASSRPSAAPLRPAGRSAPATRSPTPAAPSCATGLEELVAVPTTDPPQFQAALSVAGVLAPDVVVAAWTTASGPRGPRGGRPPALEESTAQGVQRVFLVEVEYSLAMAEAEAAWVRSLRTELVEGTLSGVAEWRAYHAAAARRRSGPRCSRKGRRPNRAKKPGRGAATPRPGQNPAPSRGRDRRRGGTHRLSGLPRG